SSGPGGGATSFGSGGVDPLALPGYTLQVPLRSGGLPAAVALANAAAAAASTTSDNKRVFIVFPRSAFQRSKTPPGGLLSPRVRPSARVASSSIPPALPSFRGLINSFTLS